MSQTNDHFDPLAELRKEVHEGQVYKDARTSDRRKTDELRVVYTDENSLLIRYDTDDGPHHSVHDRQQFEAAVSSGRYSLIEPGTESPRMPDDFDSIRALIRRMRTMYNREGSRTGKHKAQAMEELYEEIQQLAAGNIEEFDFEGVDGIGAGAAENLREAGFHTAMDVQRVDKEEIMKVPLMGKSNTENLLEAVEA